MPIVRMDMRRVVDQASLHEEFARAFGFPGWYGRNWDAWIDCMRFLDQPDAGMTAVHCVPPEPVTLVLEHAPDLMRRDRTMLDQIIACSALINMERAEVGLPAVLALAFRDG